MILYYAYDHSRRRARGPFSLRGNSIPYEVEEHRQYAKRAFDANRFWEVLSVTTRRDKSNKSDAWLARWVHLLITSSSETATVGHRDIPLLHSHAKSWYQRSLHRTVSDVDRGVVHPGAVFPPHGHNLLRLMPFEPPDDHLYWLDDRDGVETAARMNPVLETFTDISSLGTKSSTMKLRLN